MAARTRLMKEMQEIRRDQTRGRGESDVRLQPDEMDIYKWTAKIKVTPSLCICSREYGRWCRNEREEEEVEANARAHVRMDPAPPRVRKPGPGRFAVRGRRLRPRIPHSFPVPTGPARGTGKKHGCCAGHVQSNAVVVAIVVMTMRSTRLHRARTGPLHDELLSSQCALQVR